MVIQIKMGQVLLHLSMTENRKGSCYLDSILPSRYTCRKAKLRTYIPLDKASQILSRTPAALLRLLANSPRAHALYLPQEQILVHPDAVVILLRLKGKSLIRRALSSYPLSAPEKKHAVLKSS